MLKKAEASESVSAQCLKGEAYSFSPARPELLLAAHARWYVEPLSDARTLLADFFSILLGTLEFFEDLPALQQFHRLLQLDILLK
jgi:hypothetical protein